MRQQTRTREPVPVGPRRYNGLAAPSRRFGRLGVVIRAAMRDNLRFLRRRAGALTPLGYPTPSTAAASPRTLGP